MKVLFISDNTWGSYENQIRNDKSLEITYKAEDADKILLLFRNDKRSFDYANEYSQKFPGADIFIKPLFNTTLTRQITEMDRRIYFLVFKDKDVHINDFRLTLHKAAITHIDHKIICNEPEFILQDALFHELYTIYLMVNGDVFKDLHFRFSKNNHSIHCNYNHSKFSLTGSVFVSDIYSFDDRLEIFTCRDGNFLLTNPNSYRKLKFMDRYAASFLYLIKRTRGEWRRFQYDAVLAIALKIETGGIVCNTRY